jgi:hypothetical protein
MFDDQIRNRLPIDDKVNLSKNQDFIFLLAKASYLQKIDDLKLLPLKNLSKKFQLKKQLLRAILKTNTAY